MVVALYKDKHFVLEYEKLTLASDHKPLLNVLGDIQLCEMENPQLTNLKEKAIYFKFDMVQCLAGSTKALVQCPGCPRTGCRGRWLPSWRVPQQKTLESASYRGYGPYRQRGDMLRRRSPGQGSHGIKVKFQKIFQLISQKGTFLITISKCKLKTCPYCTKTCPHWTCFGTNYPKNGVGLAGGAVVSAPL